MKSLFLKILSLLFLASVLGAGFNLLRTEEKGGIAWAKDWSSSMEIVAQEMGIRVFSLEEAQQTADQGLALIVDARPYEEYLQGRIPGAISLPAHDMDTHLPDVMMMISPEFPVMVYCGGADCEDSLIVAKAIKELGVQEITLFKGGMQAWRASDLPEEGI